MLAIGKSIPVDLQDAFRDHDCLCLVMEIVFFQHKIFGNFKKHTLSLPLRFIYTTAADPLFLSVSPFLEYHMYGVENHIYYKKNPRRMSL
jgi:hypothetical protein